MASVLSPRLPHFAEGKLITRDIVSGHIDSITYISPVETICFKHLSNKWLDESLDAVISNLNLVLFLNSCGVLNDFKTAYLKLNIQDVYMKNPRLISKIPRTLTYQIDYLSNYEDCITQGEFRKSFCKIAISPLEDDAPLKSIDVLFQQPKYK